MAIQKQKKRLALFFEYDIELSNLIVLVFPQVLSILFIIIMILPLFYGLPNLFYIIFVCKMRNSFAKTQGHMFELTRNKDAK